MFLTYETYCSHDKNVHLTEDFTCVICNAIFDCKDLVDVHIKKIHKAISTSGIENQASMDIYETRNLEVSTS